MLHFGTDILIILSVIITLLASTIYSVIIHHLIIYFKEKKLWNNGKCTCGNEWSGVSIYFDGNESHMKYVCKKCWKETHYFKFTDEELERYYNITIE